jgi:hypothetical protein
MDDKERQHLARLLQTYKHRLRLLEEQEALSGRQTEPKIIMEIETLREVIADTEKVFADPDPASDNNPIDMPFVIVAMTREEALSLTTRALFQSRKIAEEDKDLFEAVHDALQEQGIDALDSYYGVDRESWRPYQQRTIREIVEEIETRIGSEREEGQLASIAPRFRSADFFASDQNVRRETWTALKRSGCIVIIDAISLFHPLICAMLEGSHLISNENNRVAMLVLSPISAQRIRVNQIIAQQIDLKLELLSHEFDKKFNKLYEVAFGDDRTLRRWIFTTLPQLADTAKRSGPHPDNISIVRTVRGKPAGIDRMIYAK